MNTNFLIESLCCLYVSDNNLQLCPKFNQGKMRPTGKAETDRSIHDPFSETSDARRHEYDNCGHVQFNAKMTESSGVSDSVSASVEKTGGSYEKGLFP
jgi:hypothetical protein